MDKLAPTERFLRRTVLLLLLMVVLGGVLAAALPVLQGARDTFDVIAPSILALVMLGLAVYLYRRPDSLLPVIRVTILYALLGIAICVWYFTLIAWHSTDITLVDSLPPITPLLVPLLLAFIVLLRPQRLMEIALGSWLLVAVPILAYLVAHPHELASQRGLDMVITLGPVTLIVVSFIPFQLGIEQWIAQLQIDRAQAQALAERDALTGLFNRGAGEHMLTGLVTAPTESDVLIMFDIDHFKKVNDTHGHPAGDAVLREVATRCNNLLRKGDVLTRWGGEEFLMLMRCPGDAGVARVANALRTAISGTPIAPAGTVTASFGVARFQPDDTQLSWVKRADVALYEAKSTGRNRVVGIPTGAAGEADGTTAT